MKIIIKSVFFIFLSAFAFLAAGKPTKAPAEAEDFPSYFGLKSQTEGDTEAGSIDDSNLSCSFNCGRERTGGWAHSGEIPPLQVLNILNKWLDKSLDRPGKAPSGRR